MHKFSVGSFILWVPLFMLAFCTPPASQSDAGNGNAASLKKMVFEDRIYEDRIKTVQFYPIGAAETDVLNPPVVNMAQASPLVLEFDDLGKEYCNYYAKLYHCNFDWTRSSYVDLQFVSDINETLLQSYTNSINTKVRYTHYKYVVPKVKVSGNFLLVVYRNGNQNDVVITKRFVVYNPVIDVVDSVLYPVRVQDRDQRQQVNCIVQYGLYDIPNPQDVRVVIRQNGRWDNAIVLQEPLYIQVDKKALDYSFFDGRNTFPGGNEYRYFDIRNLRIKGMNVATYATSDTNNIITLVEDKPRNSLTYSEQIDINGRYVIQRAEATDNSIEADYANVLFTFKPSADFRGDVYLMGQLTDWRLDPDKRMKLDEKTGIYSINQVLKQGFYNYQYCLVTDGIPDWNYFEGDYSITENWYDILVYYRIPNQFNDIVIGYASTDYRGKVY